MLEQHYTYRQQLDSLSSQIKTMDAHVRMDLLKLWRTADNLFADLDKELVACRRRQRPTSRYQTILANLTTQLQTIEKRLTFAHLL